VSSEESRYRVTIPPDLLPDHVLGLLETLYSLGGDIDPMYIGDAIGENIRILPHAIDLAEALNLVTYQEGKLILTKFGERIVKENTKTVKKLLRSVASKLEPLREIIKILKEKGFLTVEEYREIIHRIYPDNFNEAFKHILIWGAFLSIFRMSDDDTLIIPIDIKGL